MLMGVAERPERLLLPEPPAGCSLAPQGPLRCQGSISSVKTAVLRKNKP